MDSTLATFAFKSFFVLAPAKIKRLNRKERKELPQRAQRKAKPTTSQHKKRPEE
jgi:hypothetical protein